MNIEKHPFEPFLPTGARILFLGSFPPQPHRWCMPFYYPNWINDFWRIIGLIFYADKDLFCIPAEKRFDEAAIRDFCTREGLAFYDTACEVRRLKDNASDAFLEIVKPTDVSALLLQLPHCNTLVTTGQKATEVIAQTFGCDIPPVGGSIDITISLHGIPDQVGDDERNSGDDVSGVRDDERRVRDDAECCREILQASWPAATGHPLEGGEGIPDQVGDDVKRVGDDVKGENLCDHSTVMPGEGLISAMHRGDLLTVMPGEDRASHTRRIRFWRMPSTSRAYPLALAKKAEAYKRLFE